MEDLVPRGRLELRRLFLDFRGFGWERHKKIKVNDEKSKWTRQKDKLTVFTISWGRRSLGGNINLPGGIGPAESAKGALLLSGNTGSTIL